MPIQEDHVKFTQNLIKIGDIEKEKDREWTQDGQVFNGQIEIQANFWSIFELNFFLDPILVINTKILGQILYKILISK